MKATQAFTLRVPLGWQSLASVDVRSMLAAYLQRPTPNLPADPGPGDARLSLSLPARAVKVIAALLNDSESASLRRIIAASRGLAPAEQVHSLPLERARSRVLEAEVIKKPRALLLGGDGEGKPSCYSGGEDRWRRESSESQKAFWQMERRIRPAVESDMKKKESASFKSSVLPVLLKMALWGGIFFGIVYYVLARFSGTQASAAAGTPGPRFVAWRPGQ